MWGALCELLSGRRNVAEASIVDDRESGAVDRVGSGQQEEEGLGAGETIGDGGGRREKRCCWRRSRNHRNLFPLSGMGNPISLRAGLWASSSYTISMIFSVTNSFFLFLKG